MLFAILSIFAIVAVLVVVGIFLNKVFTVVNYYYNKILEEEMDKKDSSGTTR